MPTDTPIVILVFPGPSDARTDIERRRQLAKSAKALAPIVEEHCSDIRHLDPLATRLATLARCSDLPALHAALDAQLPSVDGWLVIPIATGPVQSGMAGADAWLRRCST